jgi:hypothetical protein
VHAVGNMAFVYNSCYGNQATVEYDAANNMVDVRAANMTCCDNDVNSGGCAHVVNIT